MSARLLARDRLRLLGGGIRALWQAFGKLEAAVAGERAEREALAARVEQLERERGLGRGAGGRRVPLASAAQRLGASRQHVHRLGLAGVLDLLDVREPGAARAVWTVGLDSLERLLTARREVRAGLLGQAESAESGRAPRDVVKRGGR